MKDEKIISSFQKTVAATLDVAAEKIINIKAKPKSKRLKRSQNNPPRRLNLVLRPLVVVLSVTVQKWPNGVSASILEHGKVY